MNLGMFSRGDDDLILRCVSPTCKEDLEFLFNTRKHPEVCKMLFGRPPECLADSNAYVASRINSGQVIFFIIEKGHEKVGYCQISGETDVSAELGWVIHFEHQGKGYGKYAVELLVEIADVIFKDKPKKEYVLWVKCENQKAISIYKKFGFNETEHWEDKIKMVSIRSDRD